MNLLPNAAFLAARRFIETTARPLEVARLRFHFDQASSESVRTALDACRNADGGFGHALEPDLRAAESSALCTSLALQVLRATRAPSTQAYGSASIVYLLNCREQQNAVWRIIPKSAERSPHAPWWNQIGREEAFEGFSLNPTAEILGYLYEYRYLVPEAVLTLVSEHVLRHICGLQTIEMHELLCSLRLLQTEVLPETFRERLHSEVRRLMDQIIALDPAQWREYCLRPLQVVDCPESPFLAGREDAVAANLDYEIAAQGAAGSWTPTWTWGDAFPDDWKLARQEWEGIITLEKLLLLQRFHRIEGIA